MGKRNKKDHVSFTVQRGKQQGTEIGFALRERYGKFLNNLTYNPYEVRFHICGAQELGIFCFYTNKFYFKGSCLTSAV